MNKTSKTIFLSDIHLEENRPEITQCFLRFLQTCDHRVDAVYILGDLFEVWIGDDVTTPFHDEIIQGLAALKEKGIPLYILLGNRDFLIGKAFLERTGCILLPDKSVINLYDKPILLMHGDLLCTQDVAYMKARVWLHNRILQTLFLCLPRSIRLGIADKMRAKSMLHTSSTASDIMDVTQAEVEKVMRDAKVHDLIHGHTHRPGQHDFFIDQQPATRLVLGAWHDAGYLLIWDAEGNKTASTVQMVDN